METTKINKYDRKQQNKLNLAYFSSFCPNRKEKSIQYSHDGDNQGECQSATRMREKLCSRSDF